MEMMVRTAFLSRRLAKGLKLPQDNLENDLNRRHLKDRLNGRTQLLQLEHRRTAPSRAAPVPLPEIDWLHDK